MKYFLQRERPIVYRKLVVESVILSEGKEILLAESKVNGKNLETKSMQRKGLSADKN